MSAPGTEFSSQCREANSSFLEGSGKSVPDCDQRAEPRLLSEENVNPYNQYAVSNWQKKGSPLALAGFTEFQALPFAIRSRRVPGNLSLMSTPGSAGSPWVELFKEIR